MRAGSGAKGMSSCARCPVHVGLHFPHLLLCTQLIVARHKRVQQGARFPPREEGDPDTSAMQAAMCSCWQVLLMQFGAPELAGVQACCSRCGCLHRPHTFVSASQGHCN